MDNVSWEDVQEFLSKLNNREGGGTTVCRPKLSGNMRAVPVRRPLGIILMSTPSHGTKGIATNKRIQSVRNCQMLGDYTICWVMCGSGATMEGGHTRRMRRLIRQGRQMLAPLVSSGVAVGTSLRSTCGRPTASGAPPANAAATLASAVRVQEDRGKSKSRAGRAGQTERSAVSPAQLPRASVVSSTHQPTRIRPRKTSRSLQDHI